MLRLNYKNLNATIVSFNYLPSIIADFNEINNPQIQNNFKSFILTLSYYDGTVNFPNITTTFNVGTQYVNYNNVNDPIYYYGPFTVGLPFTGYNQFFILFNQSLNTFQLTNINPNPNYRSVSSASNKSISFIGNLNKDLHPSY